MSGVMGKVCGIEALPEVWANRSGSLASLHAPTAVGTVVHLLLAPVSLLWTL